MMTESNERRRFSKEIAMELIEKDGAFAHLVALQHLEEQQSEDLRTLWRDVLAWLDEITGEGKC